MAEAYLRSLHIKNLEVISSGTVAEINADINGPLSIYARPVLEHHKILQYAKPMWDQLTPERLHPNDLVICMNQLVFYDCKDIAPLPGEVLVWNILDFNEYEAIHQRVLSESERVQYAEGVYQQIKKKIDDLVLNLPTPQQY